MSLDFVAIDFETANQSRASVCQIGIVRIIDGVPGNKATLYITPPPGYEKFAPICVGVHGITAPDVVGAPAWPDILDRIVKFTYDGELPLVGHNASVERSCITKASEAHGITPPAFDYFDTLKLARNQWPKESTHSLGKLTASLGLPAFAHHDAGEDAEACARLLLRVAAERGVNSLDQLPVGWMNRPRATNHRRQAA